MIVAKLTYALMVFGTGLQEPQDLRIQWLCAARRFPKAGSVIYLKPPEKEQEHEKTTQTRNGDDLQPETQFSKPGCLFLPHCRPCTGAVHPYHRRSGDRR